MKVQTPNYGITIVQRPKIKATKVLDLSGPSGRVIVRRATARVLTTHKKTFAKLADM